MKKWYFSKNGKVSGPLNVTEAKNLLAKDPDYYAWQPSFTQWQPVSNLNEFNDVVPTPVAAAQIPEELIEEFIAKKKRLENKLTSLYQRIDLTSTALYEFEKEISIYKRLTHNLSDEVKNNITSIEQQYNSLNKNLTALKNVAEIAHHEIDDIVTDFDHQVASKTPVHSKKVTQQSPQTPVADSQKTVSNDKSNISRLHPERKNQQVANAIVETAETEVVEDKDLQHTEKHGFSGVKSMFKSVFKGDDDSALQAENIPTTVPKDYIEQPILTQENEAVIPIHDEQITVTTEDVDADVDADVDDEDEKSRRMRRRRRRR